MNLIKPGLLILLNAASDWMNYLGHFHPLVVHLPIGILFIAFILEFLSWKSVPAASLHQAIIICFAAGTVSAALSCLFGWFLSQDGGYEENTLQLHQWMGIAVAIVSGTCWLLKTNYSLPAGKRKPYIAILIILFLLLTLTGHFGGSMTHGEDYLTAGLPQPMAGWFGIQEKKDTSHHVKKIITHLPEAVVYTDLVEPVLDEKCYSCHSSKKIKGALRMDREDLLFKGGKHGEVIKRGNAEESEMMVRVLLPKDNDKRMPPENHTPISKEEIALLHWWIKNGADTKKKVKELPAEAALLPVLNALAGPAPDTIQLAPLSKVFDQKIPAAPKTAIGALTSLGVLVAPVAKEKTLLQVSCVNYPQFDNSKTQLMLKLAENIAWLKLSHTAITDETLAQLPKLKNLVSLHLEGTAISTAGVSRLQPLSNLEYINIVQTKVDDEGLLALAGIKSLKHIYCWNSRVTQKGIDRFKQKNPSVKIEGGSLAP